MGDIGGGGFILGIGSGRGGVSDRGSSSLVISRKGGRAATATSSARGVAAALGVVASLSLMVWAWLSLMAVALL